MRHPEELVLEVTSGPCDNAHHRISANEEFIVGRDRMSSCYIMDPRLSRQHFVIAVCGCRWVVRDLKSANGTFVNGELITVCKLNSKDIIQAGDTMFRVYLEPMSIRI